MRPVLVANDHQFNHKGLYKTYFELVHTYIYIYLCTLIINWYHILQIYEQIDWIVSSGETGILVAEDGMVETRLPMN